MNCPSSMLPISCFDHVSYYIFDKPHPHATPTHLSLFSQLGQHDDHAHRSLPNHSPEVVDGVQQWPLRGDVRTFLGITLQHAPTHTRFQNCPSTHLRIQVPKGCKNLRQDRQSQIAVSWSLAIGLFIRPFGWLFIQADLILKNYKALESTKPRHKQHSTAAKHKPQQQKVVHIFKMHT